MSYRVFLCNFLFFIIFFGYSGTGGGSPWKRIIFKSYSDCTDRAVITSNLTVRIKGPKIIINGNITVTADLPRELDVRGVLPHLISVLFESLPFLV